MALTENPMCVVAALDSGLFPALIGTDIDSRLQKENPLFLDCKCLTLRSIHFCNSTGAAGNISSLFCTYLGIKPTTSAVQPPTWLWGRNWPRPVHPSLPSSCLVSRPSRLPRTLGNVGKHHSVPARGGWSCGSSTRSVPSSAWRWNPPQSGRWPASLADGALRWQGNAPRGEHTASQSVCTCRDDGRGGREREGWWKRMNETRKWDKWQENAVGRSENHGQSNNWWTEPRDVIFWFVDNCSGALSLVSWGFPSSFSATSACTVPKRVWNWLVR